MAAGETRQTKTFIAVTEAVVMRLGRHLPNKVLIKFDCSAFLYRAATDFGGGERTKTKQATPELVAVLGDVLHWEVPAFETNVKCASIQEQIGTRPQMTASHGNVC